MHRSGTSALTRTLNLLGVELGQGLMPPKENENDRGYWEHNAVYHLHESLLEALGSSWDDCLPLPPDWRDSAQAAAARREGLALLDQEFAGLPLWGVKDPRLCRLLPLWLSAFETLPKTKRPKPLFVIAVRNPCEAAASLVKREKMSMTKGLWLWLDHMLHAEALTEGYPRVFVNYANLLEDWRAEAARIGKALRVSWPVKAGAAAKDIEAFLSPGLRRQFKDDDLGEAPDSLREWLKTAFDAFRGAGCGEALDAAPGYASLKAHFFQTAAFLAGSRDSAPERVEPPAGVSYFLRALTDRDRHIGNLNGMLIQRSGQINELSNNLEDRDRHIRNLSALLSERDKQIGKLQAAMSGRERRLGDLAAAISERNRRAEAIDKGLQAHDGRLNELASSLGERGDEIAKLSKALSERESRISELNQTVRDRDEHVGVLDQQIADSGRHIRNLEAIVVERDKAIVRLEGKRDELARLGDRLEKSLAKEADALAALKEKKAALKRQIEERESQAAALRGQLSQAENRADETDRALAVARREAQEKTAQIANLEAERLRQRTALAEIQGQVADLDARRQSAEHEAAALGDALAKAQARVSELEGRAADASRQADQLRGTIAERQRACDELTERLALARREAASEIASRDEALDALNQKIAARERQLDDMARRLSDQQEETGELGLQTERLQARVRDLEQALSARDSELAEKARERDAWVEAERLARGDLALMEAYLASLAETRWFRTFSRFAKVRDPRQSPRPHAEEERDEPRNAPASSQTPS